MTLSVGIIGDNPQQPSILAETYVPDQLIAGNFHLVSEAVTVSGASALPRGTVMGISSSGSITSSVGKTPGTGTITVAVLPTNGDTVTIQGTVITFNTQTSGQINQIPVANQVLFNSGMTVAQVAQAFVEVLSASLDVNLVKMTYSLAGAVVTARAVAYGTGGNAFTLATSNATAFTLSGATLAGGTNNAGTATIGTISGGPATKRGSYQVVLTSATQGNVTDPGGNMLGVTTMGTAFVNPEINFTITTGGSPAAGDIFVISVADATLTNVWKLCTSAAADGSNAPQGILADFCDPSSGNVAAGVYVTGEFNGNAIVFDSSLTPQVIRAAFRGNGIFIKNVISASDPS